MQARGGNMNIKIDDIVVRKSYQKDIFFVVEKIEWVPKKGYIAILSGLIQRIKADAPLDDLEKISREERMQVIQNLEDKMEKRRRNYLENCRKRNEKGECVYIGKILHLDGDRRYSEKSARYYRRIGLDAVVRNIAERQQPYFVRNLLQKYRPDILIVTGHDSMLKNGVDYHDLNNYRNSKHFIQTVQEARKWGKNSEELVIFAGACQSYFEAIMLAGADFASSPGRILIDFMDPLIVAEKVATTDQHQYVTVSEIMEEIKEGMDGIGGTGARGRKKTISM